MGKRLFSALLMALLAYGVCHPAPRSRIAANVMKRVFAYAATIDTAHSYGKESYSYLKYNIKTNRRNAILMAVPTMYAVAHGGAREYMGETYDKVKFGGIGKMEAQRLLERTTIPHGRKAMPTLLPYLTPNIYGDILIDNRIISPFHRKNRRYYKYKIRAITFDTAVIAFTPRLKNTQLVRGSARIIASTGRVISTNMDGEFDMVRFHISAKMGDSGLRSLLPEESSLNARFIFLGNDITMEQYAMHWLPKVISDTVANRNDTTLLNAVRPMELTAHERKVLSQLYKEKIPSSNTESKKEKAKKKLYKRLWDNVGERIFVRTKERFGPQNQGYFRLSPLINPLYIGYSGRRGITYKFDLRSSYMFSGNSSAEMRFKAGYSFKQHQFYFNLPASYYFDYRRNGYVRIEIGNGNRIFNSSVADAVKKESTDSIDWDKMNLTYFKDFYLKTTFNYDFSSRFGFAVALVSHRRSAVDKTGFEQAGKPTSYISSAPMLELRYRPAGYSGPVVTADYERSIKGFMGANIEYERYEFDAQYIHRMSRLSSLQMRVGTGFYSHKGKDWFFLDYTNFHDENIPEGWNDKWANQFELLNSNWYNASEYYIRTNVTYETPLLLLAWIPIAGHFIEKERIYVNSLVVKHLHPYVEYGYGFATRLFSMGMFVAQENGKFNGFGCKFGLELFRDW